MNDRSPIETLNFFSVSLWKISFPEFFFFLQVYPTSHPPKSILMDGPLKKEFNCSDLTPMMKEFFKSQKLVLFSVFEIVLIFPESEKNFLCIKYLAGGW